MSEELQRIWAGWRSSYVVGSQTEKRVPPGDGTIFERIFGSGLPDDETYVLARGERCGAILNVYPYGTGHLMVLPLRAVPDLLALTEDEYSELWSMVRSAVTALRAAYEPDGMNVGTNIGTAGGASIPNHLHVHCLPRWASDTTFLTSIAQTRMIPEPLDMTWEKVRSHWPG
ncbi:MAG: HIT family protein [Acidimicrobiales bacterium]